MGFRQQTCRKSSIKQAGYRSWAVKRSMKKVGLVLGVVTLLAMLASLVDFWQFGSLKRRAFLIKPGATKVEVQRVLGRPTTVFMPYTGTNFLVWVLSVPSETWAYGSTFDLPSALHGELPLHLRMFRPESNDLTIVFGASGRVAQVIVPSNAP